MDNKKEKSIFKNKDFMLLWLGQWVSLFGSNMHSIAVMWYVLEKTGSAFQTGTTLLFTVLPMVIISPITGAFADRWDRKKMIVLSDLSNGILVGIISLLIYTNNMKLWMLYLISALMSVSHAFFRPAIGAAVPSIVSKENLIKANSLTQITRNSTSIFGPVIGGILIAVIGIPGLFLLDSISYILSGISESFIYIPKVKRETYDSFNLKEDIKEGIRFTLKKKELLHFIIVGGVIINFFLAPLSMFITIFSRETLNLGSKGAGTLLSGIAIGSLAMSLILPLVNRKIGHYTLTFIGLTCEGLCLVLFSISSNFYAAMGSLILLGVAIGICNISLNTVFQTLIPNEMMGRVGSSIGVLCGVTMPLGIFLGGLMIEKFSLTSISLLSGIVVAIAGFSTIKSINKPSKKELAGEN